MGLLYLLPSDNPLCKASFVSGSHLCYYYLLHRGAGWIVASSQYPNLQTMPVTWFVKRASVVVIQLRIFKWGDYVRLPGWTLSPVTNIFIREIVGDNIQKRWQYNRGGRDWCGPESRKAPATRNWKRYRTDFLLGPLEGVSDFWLPKLWENKFVLF